LCPRQPNTGADRSNVVALSTSQEVLWQKVESVEGTQRKKGLSVRTEDRYSGGDVGGFPMRERDSSIHEAGEVEQLYGRM
jgi:hypothetical protein